MTQIVAFAGKKQSGKNSSCNFITMLHLCDLGVCKRARLNEAGQIEISDIMGETIPGQEWMNFNSPLLDTKRLINEMKVVKTYALSTPLKQTLIDNFNIPYESVYGSDDEKNQKIPLKWENMPGIITKEQCQEYMDNYGVGQGMSMKEFRNHLRDDFGLTLHGKGRMTGREVMQFYGQDIVRKMSPTAWVNTLIEQIKKDNFKMALVCDVRDSNDIKKIRKEGGLIIGLTKNRKSSDRHSSEDIDFTLCDTLIHNEDMSVLEQGYAVYNALVELKCDTIPRKGT